MRSWHQVSLAGFGHGNLGLGGGLTQSFFGGFSPRNPGKMIQFDLRIFLTIGLVQPPTRNILRKKSWATKLSSKKTVDSEHFLC